MNKERLLNVAKALRESPAPNDFCMSRYGNACGTPACALGHYAARTDLQSGFLFDVETGGECGAVRDASDPTLSITHVNEKVLAHFKITEAEASRIFGCESEAEDLVEARELPVSTFLAMSCGTASEAADWIERFVAE